MRFWQSAWLWLQRLAIATAVGGALLPSALRPHSVSWSQSLSLPDYANPFRSKPAEQPPPEEAFLAPGDETEALADSTPTESAANQTLRLRVYWGGGPTADAARRWRGKLRAPGGRLVQLQHLGAAADIVATATETDGEIVIDTLTPRLHNAFDVTIEVGTATQLELELATDDNQPPQKLTASIESLAAQPFRTQVGSNGAQVLVQRSANDRLRVNAGRERMIFAPSEKLELAIEAALPNAEPHSPLDITVELRRGRNGSAVWSEPRRVDFPVRGPAKLAFDATLPTEEGVYTVHLTAQRPPGLKKVFMPLVAGKSIAERSFQLVVFDPQRRQRLSDDETSLATIDPTSSRWWERIPNWAWPRRMPWRLDRPLGSEPPQVVSQGGNQYVELPARGGDPLIATGEAWHAYPLPIQAPGTPHVIEIRYPAGSRQQLTVSVFDRSAAGALSPLGVSTTVNSDEWTTRTDATGELILRRLFWPKTQSPLLVISNHHSKPARFGKMTVSRLNYETAANDQASLENENLLISTCLTNPRMGETVGATLQRSVDGSFITEDWQTWYETAQRLADYAERSGFNAAAVKIASPLGTVYPSRVLPSLPGVDRGPLATGVVDLPEKDLLELLLLEFDRRGLRLVPTVEFAGSSAEPVLAELIDRYGHHPSLAGVAIDLGDDNITWLNGIREDDLATLNRFITESQLEWPANSPRTIEAMQAAVAGPWLRAWQTWRAEQTTQACRQLAQRLSGGNPKRRLFLFATGINERTPLEPQLRPQLDRSTPMSQLLLAAGIDAGALAKELSVTLVVRHAAPRGESLAGDAYDRWMNELLQDAPEFDSPATAVLLTQQPGSHRLESLERSQPFGPGQVLATLTTAIVAAGEASAADYTTAIASNRPAAIFAGGDTPTLVLNKRLTSLRRQLTQAENASRTKVASQQPLVVYSQRDAIELMNPTPWPVAAKLSIETADCQGEWTGTSLDSSPSVADRYAAGQHILQRTVPPFGYERYEFKNRTANTQTSKVLGVRSVVSPVAAEVLQQRLNALRNRDLNAERSYTDCPNPSFEQLNQEGRLVGWQALAGVGGGRLALETEAARDGNRAVQMALPPVAAAAEPRVGIRSLPFTAPATGQLAMTFYVRAKQIPASGQLRVRLASADGSYNRSTTISRQQLVPQETSEAAEIATGETAPSEWRPYAFAVWDLPLKPTQLQVSFELAGGGELAIDHLEMFDLVFPLDFYGSESAKQKLALLRILRSAESALEQERYTDCCQLLDGYWPRFLLEHTPPVANENVAKQSPDEVAIAPSTKPTATPEKAPAVSNRWRDYLPGFMRF